MNAKFANAVKKEFWKEAEYIKAMLKELDEANNDTSKLILTEQFNLWFIEWMKESARQLEKFFEENTKWSIQDFKEIDPTSTVVDTVQEEKSDDVIESLWNQ